MAQGLARGEELTGQIDTCISFMTPSMGPIERDVSNVKKLVPNNNTAFTVKNENTKKFIGLPLT